jgi:hypothetical protein
VTRSHGRTLTFLGQLRWSRGAAIGFCVVLGTLLPAAFGLLAGIPEPIFHDERSYILGADTFASGRLTNPSPALPEFFEAPHVLVVPTYQSKYPPGQAAALALGTVIFGHPIWGVWIGCGLFAGSLCWMLQAWVPRRWALVITVMSAATLGTTTYWAQSYWGGMVAAAGAALAFGGIRRTLRSPRMWSSVIASIGVVVLATTRPFEGVLSLIPSGALLVRWLLLNRALTLRQKLTRFILPAGAVLAIGLACLAGYNQVVTGNPWRAPYQAHLDQYFHQGVFIFSPLREPERKPVERIAAIYQHYAVPPAHGLELVGKVAAHFVTRLPGSIGSAFGSLLAPSNGRPYYAGVMLWMALLVPILGRSPGRTFFPILVAGIVAESIAWLYLPAYPLSLAPFIGTAIWVTFERFKSSRWAGFFAATVATVAFGQTLVPWWLPHYVAPVVPIVMAAVAISVHRTAVRSRVPAERLGLALIVLLVAHLLAASLLHRSVRAEQPESIQNGFGARTSVLRDLGHKGGTHLVFVRYDSDYPIHREWVYNPADLTAAPVIFAHDLGQDRNPALMALYPARSVWVLCVSLRRTRLDPYPSSLQSEEGNVGAMRQVVH